MLINSKFLFLEKTGEMLESEEELKETRGSNGDPIICKICVKPFAHPHSLKQHMPVHSGTTQCPICKAVLSRKYHLKLHIKSKHKNFSDKLLRRA